MYVTINLFSALIVVVFISKTRKPEWCIVIYWSTCTCIRFLKVYCREKKIMFYHSACVAIYPICTIHVNKLYIAYRLHYLLIFKVNLMFTICWKSWLHIITVPVKPHDLYKWAPRGLGALWPWNHWILEGSNLLF